MIILIGLLSAAIVLWLCSINWRLSVKTALYAVVLEGALRKWALPQASELIYFLKDGILMGAYLGYSLKTGSIRLWGIGGWIIAAAILISLQAINPALNSVLVGVLGVKGYLMYVPLCLLLPDLFRTTAELQTFLRWYLLLCIPVCLLGSAQFSAPADSPLNVYAASTVEQQVEAFGEEGNVRVTGTFPYLSGYSVYLAVCVALIFSLLVHLKHWRWRVLAAVELILLTGNLFMTGARSAVLTAVILAMGFSLFSLFDSSLRSRLLAVMLITSSFLAFAMTVYFFPDAVEAFTYRSNESGDSLSQRILASFEEPVSMLGRGGLLGYGAGATQNACNGLRVMLQLGLPSSFAPLAESEPTRVMLEVGLPAFLVWYGLRFYLLWLLWKTCRSLHTPFLRLLALAAFFIHALWFTGQIVNNTTAGVYYWFFAGFAFLLPKLDRKSLVVYKMYGCCPRPTFPAVSLLSSTLILASGGLLNLNRRSAGLPRGIPLV